MQDLILAIVQDKRYLENIEWGEPRSGHPEGSIKKHIEELEKILSEKKFGNRTTLELKVLIHVHDTFKKDAKKGVEITHPEGHASLAANFLREKYHDERLIKIVQYHDEPFAIWKKYKYRNKLDVERIKNLMEKIPDHNLFFKFLEIDGNTEGKDKEPLLWFLKEAEAFKR